MSIVMSSFARDVAARFHHRGCLIDEGYGNIAADLRDIAAVDPAEMKSAFAARRLEILASYGFEPVENSKPFAYADGVAIIPIHGLLINRMSWSYSFATGYNFIRSQMMAAIIDNDVKLIVYDINSPGGLASGCKELADDIFASRTEKPSLSVIDARCFSAAYFLGCAANKIVLTPSGGVGSIGCSAMHVDMSDMMSQDGVKITWIFRGDEKVDGNPYQRLSSRAKASIQRDIDYHYGLFVEAVARHRDLSEDEIRGTEAATFLPPEALDLGLIDAIETPAEAVANFFNELTSDADGGDETMTTAQAVRNPTAAPAAAAEVSPIVAAAAPAAPVVATPTAADVQAMVTAGVTAALSAERTRASAIRTCEEAKGRETLAAHLADNSTMPVEEAKAVLAAAPKATAESPNTRQQQPNGFAAAMDRTLNPNVGADTSADAGGLTAAPTPEATADRLLGNYAAATGRKVVRIGQPAA